IYIPISALSKHGLTEREIVERKFDGRYVELMRGLIARARGLFVAGLPLARMVDSHLRIDIELFRRGGTAILDAIEKAGYNTLEHRPALSKATQLQLLIRALASKIVSRKSGQGDRSPQPPVPASSTSATPRLADPPAIAESYAECNRIARAAHSSFYLAFYGLPRRKRNALCALYAFMRLVDNVSDEPGDLESKRRGLARWRGWLDEAAAGQTGGHAILPALADSMTRFHIPARYFHDLILGAEMDLTVNRYATFDRLSEYCYRVAGTVGLTCLHVFGFRDPHAEDLAERLGLAFQMTNIIRDVSGDFALGRVYLPQEDLAKFGLRDESLRGPISGQLRNLLEFEADRAWRLYSEGAPLVDQVDADSRATIWALVRTYSTLLARIEERGFDVFSGRISISSAEKLRYLLTAGMNNWWKKDALAKRAGDRRRIGGAVVRRRAG
ncbi:MAG: squalene/phytoene synthase family protein, partial [Acidobacteriota bacterium]|nr:squalene/phytoene synthase family protein [Acidobacteriota bacterium]